jgi:hypothetical protein
LTQAERRVRADRALALRQQGGSYANIGSAFGLSSTRARQIVLRASTASWHDDLPGRVRTFLHIQGLAALPEIEAAIAVAELSKRELLSAPNIGKGAAAAMTAWLAQHRLALRSP